MRKGLKSILVLILMCAMIVGTLTGCKKEEPDTDTDTTTETNTTEETETEEETDEPADTTETTETTETVAGMEGFVAFDEKVTITVPVYDRSKEGYPAVDNNYWTQWVQKEFGDKYNVEVKYVAIPRGDVMTKYSMLIAADDTPTILMEYDYPKVAQWATDGAMQPIDLVAFAKVAPTYYQKMVDNNQLGYTDMNGETFFVLSERPYYNTTYTHATFVRKDWLDAVGKGIPQNYKEYTEAIDAIMAAGLTDQAPIGLSLPTSAYVGNFAFRDFPVDEAEWAMHSSLGTASLSWGATYELLKRQNAEFNKGYFSTEYDLDANAVDSSQAKTDFINGKTYSYGNYMSANVDWLIAFYENNPDAELAIASVTTAVEPGVVDVPSYRADNPFGMIVGFSSLADENQLKAAWMYMEWMSQADTLYMMENGVEGVTYTLNADGIPIVNAEYRGEEMLNHNNNIDMTCVVHASKVVGTIEQSIKLITPQGIKQDFYDQLLQNYNNLVEISKYAYSDPIFAVAIESEAEYSATLLSLYQEYSVKLTKCKPEEFDALYAELSQAYLDAGYQEIIDERLAAYNDGKTTKLPK
jgi:putative aldouronate transport system substrate-binding protein